VEAGRRFTSLAGIDEVVVDLERLNGALIRRDLTSTVDVRWSETHPNSRTDHRELTARACEVITTLQVATESRVPACNLHRQVAARFLLVARVIFSPMRVRLLGSLLLALLGACGYPPLPSVTGNGDDANGDDAGTNGHDAGINPVIDSSPDAPQTCFGTGLLRICLASAPTGSLTISTTTPLDTDNPQMCAQVMSGGTGFCVVAATTISVEATWRATGTRPLVLIARDSIAITATGVIDVASRRGVTPEIGAGGDAATCDAGTAPKSANGTNGGGAGGSFTGLGGNGGKGGGGGGGSGGVPGAAVTAITELRGGCPGQIGQGVGAAKGAEGHGGGAVYLIAGGTITVTGGINASGEGGGHGVSGEAGGRGMALAGIILGCVHLGIICLIVLALLGVCVAVGLR
jgi:hypothetical protein